MTGPGRPDPRAARLPRWGATPAGRIGLPDQRALIAAVFGFRMVLVVTLVIRAALLWRAQPGPALLVVLGVLLALLVTAHGSWVVLVRRLTPRVPALFTDALVDLALVTTVVHLGGEAAPALAALYVVVIAGYAVLLPFTGGVAIALLASTAYLADSLVLHPGDLRPGLLGQIVVFGFVFLLVAVLGLRLRDTAARQTRLESELRQARFEASEVLSSIRAGVLTVDDGGRLVFANPSAEDLLEVNGEQGLGRPILDELARRAPEMHEALARGLATGERVARGEGSVIRSDGVVVPIGLSTAAFERQDGVVPAVTAVFTDLSELKALQELQLRTERLEAVAALSASLAHEIRNPLASIRSSVEQLAASAQADDDDRILGQLIVRESDRLSRLLGEFLDFARVRAGAVEQVDLRDLAREAIQLVEEHPDCGPGVRLELEGPATVVSADHDLLHRLVSNLLLNGVQACGGHGLVRVAVGPADPAELPPGPRLDRPARLVVSDDGPGIPGELADRLFQPFVSGRAGGSGLGLAIVQRAVEAHGGIVTVDSPPEGGATFTVYLPSRLYRKDTA